ncbi:MAG: cytidine/deoxycytidylate deaminase family protein [Spirochaetota bacterium]
MTRPTWDEYFMMIAHDVSTRATCIRRKVGAVIVKDKRILSTGYNGVPTGITHCTPETCLRNIYNVPSGQRHELCRGLHAEQNAIIQAAFHGVSIAGAIIYVTHQPCSICTKMLINAGIKKFIFEHPYNDELAQAMMDEAGVEAIVFRTEPS